MNIKDIFPTDHDVTFSQVQQDSRNVQPSDLYVAITCDETREHIQAAIQQGAVAVILDNDLRQSLKGLLPSSPIPFIGVTNSRQAFGMIAAALYPQQPQAIYAVTGTNGKSSVVTFLRQLLKFMGQKAASFGTVGLELTHADASTQNMVLPKLTTPDALSLHQAMAQLTTHGFDHFIFEASSHGLDQYRLHQAHVTVAAFTNLTQDHLDYHGTMENYFQSKSRLFTEVLTEGGAAVINAASPYAKSLCLLMQQRRVNIITYGIDTPADLEARHVRLEPGRICFDLFYHEQEFSPCVLNMAGNFQVENVLCALGMALGQGFSLNELMTHLPHLTCAKGRMELASVMPNGASIYVDYAHTPDALSRALQALRLHLSDTRKLSVVFGCGGNRDVLKRSLMGQVACELADRVIVTDDNPRDEDPHFIRAQILSSCDRTQHDREIINIPDRYQAISHGISMLSDQDILLVAGKGHEKGQIIKGQTIPFDDVHVVQEIVHNTHTKAERKSR